MVNLQAQIPTGLRDKAEQFVATGGHRDMNALVADALQRYLDSHSEALTAQYIEEDLEWGLRGSD